MNRLLIATLGLIAGLAFATPTFVTSADAATSSTSTIKPHHEKPTHHHAVHCKATKTHKCPVSHKSAKKK